MENRKAIPARKAAGICVSCGKAREANGTDSRLCEACATTHRVTSRACYHRNREAYIAVAEARKARYREAGLCLRCGGVRNDTARALCERCREKHRAAEKGYRQRERKAQGIDHYPVWDLGARIPKLEGGRFRFQLTLDMEAREAIYGIVAAYRERERAWGRQPRTHPVSFLVREAVRRWEGSRCPERKKEGRGLILEMVGVSLDGLCRRILEQHRFRHGSMVEALRAMVVYARPRFIGAVVRQRRGDEWDRQI